MLPAEWMSVLWVYRLLRWADQSSEDSFPAWCVSVWYRNLNNEEALANQELSCRIKYIISYDTQQIYSVLDGGLLITEPIRAYSCIRITAWGELTACETLVLMYQSRRRYIAEDGIFRLQHFVTLDCTSTGLWIWKSEEHQSNWLKMSLWSLVQSKEEEKRNCVYVKFITTVCSK